VAAGARKPNGAQPSWLGLIVLWIAGVDARLTILALPPVLPLIHRDLGLTETATAFLTGLPVVLLAVAAVPGSFLTARVGARRTMIAGILLLAVASGLRGAWTSLPVLFGMTLMMGIGMAIMQPAIPSLISEWFPRRVGLATAIYVNGILAGETLAPALTLPVVLPLAAGRWEASFAIWAAVILATVLVMAWLTPRFPDASGDVSLGWSPDWKRADTWRLGFLLGGSSSAYFGANAFIPDFLHAIGRPHLVGLCLTLLNAAQFPASLAAGVIASGGMVRREPFVVVAAATLGSLGIFLLQRDWAMILGAGLLGICFGFALVFCLSLPPALSARGDVHRLSAGMLAIGYAYAFVAPLLGGAAWDLSRAPATSFLGVGLGAVTILVAATSLRAGRAGT
jgi:MFS transporter, CP family, cyanate transporter